MLYLAYNRPMLSDRMLLTLSYADYLLSQLDVDNDVCIISSSFFLR